MADARQHIGQLKAVLFQEEFTRDRIGEPGCRIRRIAADNAESLRWAIERLEAQERRTPL